MEVFSKLSSVLFAMLLAWATRRHPKKDHEWVATKYWRFADGGGWIFQPRGSGRQFPKHSDILRKKHIKVAGHRGPFDGEWLYWSTRLGREPTTPTHVARLLKTQGGRCPKCRLFFQARR